MRHLVTSLLLLFVTNGVFAQFSGSAGDSFPGTASEIPFLPVEEAYQLDVQVLDEQTLRLSWQIEDNYYLYQHRFAFELMQDGEQ